MRVVVAAVLVCGCGRLGFDPVAEDVVDPQDWEPTATPTPFVRVFGSAADDSAYTIATARNGDVVLAATVLDSIDLGNGVLTTSGEAMALGRFTPSGQHVWSKAISSSAGTFTMRSIVMRNDRLSLGGHFNGTAMIDGASVTAVAGQAYLVLEADAAGALTPVTYAGSTSSGRNAQGYAIAETTNGRRAIGGVYGAQVQVAPSLELPAPDMDDGWAVLVDDNGAPTDVITFTAANYNNVRALAFDGLGNLCVIGEFSGTVSARGRTVTTTMAASFIAVLDANGGLVSFGALEGGNNTRALQVAGFATGGFAIVGRGFGTVLIGTTMLTTTSQQIVVARLDAMGTPLWIRDYGNVENETGPTIAVAPNGQIVLAFTFFGQLQIAGQTLTEVGALTGDLAVVTLDGDGNPLRAIADGGGAVEVPSAVVVDYASGDIVVAGGFNGTNTVGGTVVTSQGPDIFLLRLSLL